ncbi:MFS transporter [Bordetella bronchialis]|uniref:MFS transporter n=1 Tax=Bordetella bronchialis TaxID=463025 RepID=A0ABM6CTZ6_9BORD|nr:MFS transporter [Bordetella bronchialis]ANN67574.1 MFS transporter [Bordetella bronchialis]
MRTNTCTADTPALAAAPPAGHGATLLPAAFLALGTFAIGTEGFMIAPLLSTMASDFQMTVPQVAMLVVVFTLTMALSSPVSTVAAGRLRRRATLIFAMGLFTAGNLLAAWSPSFAILMVARIMMAVASGLYVPGANALAGAIVPHGKRGRALAIVSGGMTLAIALGLPLGALVGHAFGWRMTFLAVGAMSLTAIVGILAGIAKDAGSGIPVATLSQRLAVVRQPAILRLLSISLFWSIGAYAAYPYIAPYLSSVLGFQAAGIGATVSMWGLAAALGVMTGGTLNDRLGPNRVVRLSLLVLGLSFWVLSLATALPASTAVFPVMLAVALWGFSVWAFFPAQMARLMAAGTPSQASLALALNTSTMYLGFSIGSAMGAGILDTGAIWGIGLLAGVAQAVALLLDRRLAAVER